MIIATSLRTALALAVSAMGAAIGAAAQDAPATVDVLHGWRGADGTHMAAVRIRLSPGWKTYWRAPGDAGIPPQFDWSGSDNLASVAIHWPVPVVFTTNGLTSVGYDGDVVLPVSLTPRDPAAPIFLRAEMDLGVCEDICVPVSARLAATLPADAGVRPDARIRAALADRPLSGAEAGAGGMECTLTEGPYGPRLTASLPLSARGGRGGSEFAVVELADPAVWVSQADLSRDGDRLTATVDLAPPQGAPLGFERSGVRLTLLDRSGAVDVMGCR